jgi:hypothetical protein
MGLDHVGSRFDVDRLRQGRDALDPHAIDRDGRARIRPHVDVSRGGVRRVDVLARALAHVSRQVRRRQRRAQVSERIGVASERPVDRGQIPEGRAARRESHGGLELLPRVLVIMTIQGIEPGVEESFGSRGVGRCVAPARAGRDREDRDSHDACKIACGRHRQ